MSILPPREYPDEDEARLASALNSAGDKMLAIVDAACRLRTAPKESQRHRAIMRRSLEEAAQAGMSAMAWYKHGTRNTD